MRISTSLSRPRPLDEESGPMPLLCESMSLNSIPQMSWEGTGSVSVLIKTHFKSMKGWRKKAWASDSDGKYIIQVKVIVFIWCTLITWKMFFGGNTVGFFLAIKVKHYLFPHSHRKKKKSQQRGLLKSQKEELKMEANPYRHENYFRLEINFISYVWIIPLMQEYT